MKLRPSLTYYIYNNREYYLGKKSHGDTPYTFYSFKSLDEDTYPSITLLMREMKTAYRTTIKVRVKNHVAFLYNAEGDIANIRFNPGNPGIEIFNAQPTSDGGWFEISIPKHEIENIWEERYPVDGYLFPENLSFKEQIEF